MRIMQFDLRLDGYLMVLPTETGIVVAVCCTGVHRDGQNVLPMNELQTSRLAIDGGWSLLKAFGLRELR